MEPSVVIRPMLADPVNHNAPSGPSVMPYGSTPAVTGYAVRPMDGGDESPKTRSSSSGNRKPFAQTDSLLRFGSRKRTCLGWRIEGRPPLTADKQCAAVEIPPRARRSEGTESLRFTVLVGCSHGRGAGGQRSRWRRR